MKVPVQMTVLALAVWFPLSGFAQNVVQFTGDSGTDEFSDPESWKDGKVPGPEDTAMFSLAGRSTVTFTEDIEIKNLLLTEGGNAVEPDEVTLALEGHTLKLLNTAEAKLVDKPILLAASTQSSRTLKVENGTLICNGVWQATFKGDFPAVFILDKKTKVKGEAMGYIGQYGVGEAYILGGSQWVLEATSWAGVLGHSATSSGLLEISGKGSSFSALTDEGVPKSDIRIFFVSTQGSGTLRILDGGSFACDVVNMGNGSSGPMDPKAFSTILVDGTESTFATRILNVGGGANNAIQPSTPSGNALLAVTNGATANIGSLRVFSMETPEGNEPVCGRILIAGGTLNLGVDSETMLSEFLPGSLFEVRLREVPKAAGVKAPGELKIEGARFKLSLDPAFRAKVGDRIPLIDGEIITGTFADLPEGSTIQANGYAFTLSYQSTTAGTVGLKVTAVP